MSVLFSTIHHVLSGPFRDEKIHRTQLFTSICDGVTRLRMCIWNVYICVPIIDTNIGTAILRPSASSNPKLDVLHVSDLTRRGKWVSRIGKTILYFH